MNSSPVSDLRWFAAKAVGALPESGRPSGMFKQALTGGVELHAEGLIGDVQADRRVHGGPEKAVHVYPREHLSVLADQFPDASWAPGVLGENLSTIGITEADVRIGEIWAIGGVRLQVCQPRQPCWKIDDRMRREGVSRFIEAQGLTGWYCRVLRAATVAATDAAVREWATEAPTLAQARTLMQQHRPAPEALRALAQTPGMATEWARKLSKRADYLVAM